MDMGAKQVAPHAIVVNPHGFRGANHLPMVHLVSPGVRMPDQGFCRREHNVSVENPQPGYGLIGVGFHRVSNVLAHHLESSTKPHHMPTCGSPLHNNVSNPLPP